MSDEGIKKNNVELVYKRAGETYVGVIRYGDKALQFEGFGFAEMMTETHRFLVNVPQAGLLITRTDRTGLLPAQLEPRLLELLRTDPVSYIKANTIPDRVIDLRADRKSSLAASDSQHVPKYGGLRHGLSTLAAAFGETLYIKGKYRGEHWIFEHPATGRWADLNTIEHWLGSHDTEVQPMDHTVSWLLIKAELFLKTQSSRFFLPRDWNEFGSWISKEQLRMKLEQFKKDKANAR